MLPQPVDRAVLFRRGDAVRLIVVSLLLIGALTAILAIDVVPTGLGLQVGDIAQGSIRAPRALTFESAILTAQARADARAAVPPQYDYTPERAATITAEQAAAFERAVSPVRSRDRSRSLDRREPRTRASMVRRTRLSGSALRRAIGQASQARASASLARSPAASASPVSP